MRSDLFDFIKASGGFGTFTIQAGCVSEEIWAQATEGTIAVPDWDLEDVKKLLNPPDDDYSPAMLEFFQTGFETHFKLLYIGDRKNRSKNFSNICFFAGVQVMITRGTYDAFVKEHQ